MYAEKTKHGLRPLTATLLLICALGLAACGGGDDEAPAQAEESATSAVERSSDSLMGSRFDGSSEAAFEADLMAFEQRAPENEVAQLRSSIDFLLVYDIGSRGNKAKLYERLDGMSAQEIIDTASEQKRRKR